jgi:hypothetical protein
MGYIKMATIHHRRKVDRERQKRWRKNKLVEGHKQTLVMLTPEAQRVLDQEKSRTGESYVQIINRAIIEVGKDLHRTSDEIEVWHPGG